MSTMKLSEAIRLGAMAGPQIFWRLYDAQTHGTCAQGAAALAIGCIDLETRYYKVPFPPAITAAWTPVYAAFMNQPCPECGQRDKFLSDGLMAHLNNEHQWTREHIADMVEEIERRADAEGQPQTETVAPAVRRVPQNV